MGNDGGSIPKRRELVKEAARNPTTTELKATQHEQQEYYWSTDPLSRRPLAQPVVSDCSGKLYNKDSIIEFLLPSDEDDASAKLKKSQADDILKGAVKSLRDVVEIKFQVDREATGAARQEGAPDAGEKWKCPITDKTLGPATRAVYLVPCGHAFAESVIKEVAEEKCLQCNEHFAPNDVIPILPTDASDIARLSLRVKTLQEKGLTHSLKKAAGGGKKRKKNAEANGVGASKGEMAESAQENQDLPANGVKSTTVSATPAISMSGGIKNASTASLTAKVLEEQEERNKRRKMAKNDNLQSLFSSRDQTKPVGKSSDFMSRGYTIPAHTKR